jgi:holo-[acyl-carrier protein] synthase
MTYGTGIDLIEVERIKKAINAKDSFKEKIYSADEIAYCEATTHKFLSYAARFAAKEAFLKALGTGWTDSIKWSEIEILNKKQGKPFIRLTGRAKEIVDELKINNILVSLTHIRDYASATVILEI